jgi:signal transduction histidine kinase
MKSICRHLLLRLVATVVGLSAASSAGLYMYVRARLTSEFNSRLVAQAKLVRGMFLWDNGMLEFNPTSAELAGFGAPASGVFFEVWQADTGAVIERSPSLLAGDRHLVRIMPSPAARLIVLPDGRPGRSVAIRFLPRIDADDQPPARSATGAQPPAAPGLVLVLAGDTRDLDAALGILASALLIATTVLALASAATVIVTVGHGLRPLQQLAHEVEFIDADSLHHRFATAGVPDEIRPIGDRLNQLLDRLDEAFARERRFTADVAHELRTPLAELRAMAEVALKWPEDASAERNFRDTLEITAHMQGLVSNLLAIARCEAKNIAVEQRTIDLSEVLATLIERYAPRFCERNLSVQASLPPSALVRSDESLLTCLLDNLLSNAVSHSPDGGQVTCAIESSEDAEVWLSISNSCDDLEPGDLRQMFDRFWRKDPARTGGQHVGLGLPLASAYAHALSLELHAAIPRDGLFCIKLGFGVRPSRARVEAAPTAGGPHQSIGRRTSSPA